jgi:hypothetical protein
MKICQAGLWLVAGVFTFTLAVVLWGGIGGFFDPRGHQEPWWYAYGGAVGGLSAVFVFGMALLPLLFVAIGAWLVLARQFPNLENNARTAVPVFAAVLSALVALLVPLDSDASTFLALLLFVSLAAPRFLVRRLRPGTFAA